MQFDIATSSRKSERHNVTKQQDNRTESFHRVDTPPLSGRVKAFLFNRFQARRFFMLFGWVEARLARNRHRGAGMPAPPYQMDDFKGKRPCRSKYFLQ